MSLKISLVLLSCPFLYNKPENEDSFTRLGPVYIKRLAISSGSLWTRAESNRLLFYAIEACYRHTTGPLVYTKDVRLSSVEAPKSNVWTYRESNSELYNANVPVYHLPISPSRLKKYTKTNAYYLVTTEGSRED